MIEQVHKVIRDTLRHSNHPGLNWAVNYMKEALYINNVKDLRILCLYILNNIEKFRYNKNFEITKEEIKYFRDTLKKFVKETK